MPHRNHEPSRPESARHALQYKPAPQGPPLRRPRHGPSHQSCRPGCDRRQKICRIDRRNADHPERRASPCLALSSFGVPAAFDGSSDNCARARCHEVEVVYQPTGARQADAEAATAGVPVRKGQIDIVDTRSAIGDLRLEAAALAVDFEGQTTDAADGRSVSVFGAKPRSVTSSRRRSSP